MIGKSTGIALLMAAALLAALFAMGVFSATGVGAQAESTDANLTALNLTVNDGPDADANADVVTLDPAFDTAPDTQIYAYSAEIPKHANTLTVTPTVTALTEESVTIMWNDGEAQSVELDSTATPSVTTAEIDLTKGVVSKVEIVVADANDQNDDTAATNFVTKTFTINLNYDSPTNSDTAGDSVRLTLQAMLRANVDDEIDVNLAKFGLQSGISTDHVTINGQKPTDLSVSGSVISLVLPDMTPGDDDDTNNNLGSTTGDGTITNAAVTIRISSNAGITNPTIAGSYGIKISDDPDGAGDDAVDAQNVAGVIREIKLSPKSGASGADVTVTGTGFSGASATVFIDNTPAVEADEDADPPVVAADKMYASNNAYDPDDDTVLGTVDITDGTFTLVTDGIKKPAGEDSVDINAIDGNSNLVEEDGAQTYTFKAGFTVSPAMASWGEEVTIKTSDWTAGDITAVRFGGTSAGKVDILAANQDDEEVKVNVPSELRTGKLKVEVFTSGGLFTAASGTIEIRALDLTISPSSVVPGQQITITGSGFMATSEVTELVIGTETYTRTTSGSPIADASTSTGGSATITANVPVDIGTGSKSVSLSVGTRTGEGTITVAKPAITLSPTESLIGTTVQVTGSGYPSNGRVLLDYGSVSSLQIGQADASGNLSMSFSVPAGAGIGQTSSVKVYAIGQDTISASANHKTPGPALTVTSPVQSGGMMTISGSNFKGFSTLSEIKVGGEDALPSPAPSTDSDGNFETRVLVPALGVGSHTVRVTDGAGNPATESFQVTLQPVAPASTDPADIFADLISLDALDRIWHLNAALQATDPVGAWTFWDADPARAEFNSLTEITSGEFYVLIVTAQVDFNGRTLYPGTNFWQAP